MTTGGRTERRKNLWYSLEGRAERAGRPTEGGRPPFSGSCCPNSARSGRCSVQTRLDRVDKIQGAPGRDGRVEVVKVVEVMKVMRTATRASTVTRSRRRARAMARTRRGARGPGMCLELETHSIEMQRFLFYGDYHRGPFAPRSVSTLNPCSAWDYSKRKQFTFEN